MPHVITEGEEKREQKKIIHVKRKRSNSCMNLCVRPCSAYEIYVLFVRVLCNSTEKEVIHTQPSFIMHCTLQAYIVHSRTNPTDREQTNGQTDGQQWRIHQLPLHGSIKKVQWKY